MCLLCAALAAAGGCSRQVNGVPSDTRGASELPFDADPNTTRLPATADFHALLVPAGTPLVISLQSPLSSTNARQGDVFQAELDEPIMNSGRVVLPRGSMVNGRVLAAKSGDAKESGYLRLGLASIVVNHRTVQLHASSFFAKPKSAATQTQHLQSLARLQIVNDAGDTLNPKQPDVEFSTARRLTFRLLKSLSLPQ